MNDDMRARVATIALNCGFMLSTSHGQDTKQRMPVSDYATLESFLNAALAYERARVAKLLDEPSTSRHLDGAFLDLGCLNMKQREQHSNAAIATIKHKMGVTDE